MTHQGAQRIENVGSVKLLPLLVSSLPSAVTQAFCRPGPAPQSEDKAPSPATEVQSVEQRWGEVLLVFLSGACPPLNHSPVALPGSQQGRVEWKESREYCQKSAVSPLKFTYGPDRVWSVIYSVILLSNKYLFILKFYFIFLNFIGI